MYGRGPGRPRKTRIQCKYLDEQKRVCIRVGRPEWHGFCFQHRHLDMESEEKLAKAEVKRITNVAVDKCSQLGANHRFLLQCMEQTRLGKLEPEALVAISKAVLATCDVHRTQLEKILAKHKIMIESKKQDPASPFKFLEVPTVEALQNLNDLKEIEETEKDAVSAESQANSLDPAATAKAHADTPGEGDAEV